MRSPTVSEPSGFRVREISRGSVPELVDAFQPNGSPPPHLRLWGRLLLGGLIGGTGAWGLQATSGISHLEVKPRMYERISLFAARVLGLRLSDLKRDEGQGVTEYGLALAFVIIVLAAVLLLLGGSISTFISKVGADLTGLPASL